MTAICANLMYTRLTLREKSRAVALKKYEVHVRNEEVETLRAPLMENGVTQRSGFGGRVRV